MKSVITLGPENFQDIGGNIDEKYIRVEKPFNSLMKELFERSNIEELTQRIFAHIKTREENSRTTESGFTLVQIMHLHINFQLLALIRGSFYTELPEWIAKKTAVINRKSNNEQCCAVNAALHHEEIATCPQQISKLQRYYDQYN